MTNSFNEIIQKYRNIAFSERDKGDRFERLMQAYFLTDKKYAELKKVWLWEEFHGRDHLGGIDSGIDLVGITHAGKYWAIQCKCYKEEATIDKPDIDGFIATSSRKFKDEQGKTQAFAHRLLVCTTNRLGPNAKEAISNQNPPVSTIYLSELIEAENRVDWGKIDFGVFGDEARIASKKQPKDHQ